MNDRLGTYLIYVSLKIHHVVLYSLQSRKLGRFHPIMNINNPKINHLQWQSIFTQVQLGLLSRTY